jgi:predicted RND superfamily exporter protein
VAAALGADDVFVAVDKWKNARLDHPSATTEEVAALALPDALAAMLLTTSTTAVAFFATMICPVTSILCFALFCGLLIMFNYFLNVIFVFPALCLYDIWLMNGSTNCLINCGCGSKSKAEDLVDGKAENKKSPIHKILSTYFYFLQKFRFFIIAACIVVLATCIYFASTVSKVLYFEKSFCIILWLLV